MPLRKGVLALPLALILGTACAADSLADTLTLRSGQVVQGTYMGGTARTVKMQVEDDLKTYDVTDVATLQFTPPAPTAGATFPPRGRPATGASVRKPPTQKPVQPESGS
ncbi:MAG: hypothetical protein ABSG65_27190 [Bryobacteraceae bacterium]|jgi:hypothetical protein